MATDDLNSTEDEWLTAGCRRKWARGLRGAGSRNQCRSVSSGQIDGLLANGHLDEIALYDRQIRLWGVQAQERFD